MAEKSADLSSLKGTTEKGSMRPSKKDNRDLERRLEALESKFDQNYVRPADTADSGIHTGAGRDAEGRRRNDYPVRMYPRDPNDQLVQLKAAAPEQVFGRKILTDVDLQWMKQKLLDQQAAAQKQFVMSMYDSRDPAQRQMRDRVYPDLVREQEAIIDERLELERRLAKISLHGPQGKEDIDLLYALSSGAVPFPKGVTWDPKSWFDDDSAAAGMKRGIFNPLRIKLGRRDSASLPFDMLGSATGAASTRTGVTPQFLSPQGVAGSVAGLGLLGAPRMAPINSGI